jgi:hypothetical protein
MYVENAIRSWIRYGNAVWIFMLTNSIMQFID